MENGLLILCWAALACVNSLSWRQDNNFNNLAPSHTSMTSTTYVRSKLDCARQCKTDASCNSFFYGNITGKCLRHGNILLRAPVNAAQEMGWRYYRFVTSSVCPDNVNYFADRLTSTCYRLDPSPTRRETWVNARDACADNNETLVVLEPVEKARFVQHFLITNGELYTGNVYFIGAERQNNTVSFPPSGPDFVWIDGTYVNMTNTSSFWGKGKPQFNESKSVLGLMRDKDYGLSEVNRVNTRPFICEQPFAIAESPRDN